MVRVPGYIFEIENFHDHAQVDKCVAGMVSSRESTITGGCCMKKLIERASYFSLCEECRRHGCIVCADGTKSEEFGSISQGLGEMKTLVLAGKIAEDEAPEVRRQIETSGLQLKDADLDEFLKQFPRMKEELRKLFHEIHQELRGAHVHAEETQGKAGGKRTLH